MKKLRILVAPLNWGLGHATRCIPVIRALLEREVEVVLASDGRALALLREEFPQLPAFSLPAYRIRYSHQNMILAFSWQIPRITWAIMREYFALRQLVQGEKIDGIISDNRFGCFHHSLPTVFLTHQLHIQIPGRLFAKFVNRINHFFIRRFGECWVPDVRGTQSLAGILSAPVHNLNVHYIGPLSRMGYEEKPIQYDLVAVLSGPEPQRTYFEKAILCQLKDTSLKTLIVQGKTEEQASETSINENLTIIPFLGAQALNQALLSSEVVLSRTGYSTLMDLQVLQKKAILIPTPGQTEQEYLGEYWKNRSRFEISTLEELDIHKAWQKLSRQPFSGTASPSSHLAATLDHWLDRVRHFRKL